MPTEKFRLLVEVDSRGANQALGKVEKSAKGATAAAASLYKSFILIGGATAFISFMKSAAAAVEKQAQAEAQLEAALRSTGGAVGRSAAQLKNYARELQGAGVIGDETIIKVQSQLLTFTKITGDTFDRATASVLDLSIRMDQDLRSSAVMVGKALNDPIRGLDSLARSGIQFTDSQKAVIKELANTGRMAEAQAMILEELETQMGGANAAAAAAAGGGFKQLANALGDLKEKTEPLISRFDKLAGAIGRAITKGNLNVWSVAAEYLDSIKESVEAITQWERFSGSSTGGLDEFAMDAASARLFTDELTDALERNEAALEAAYRRYDKASEALEEYKDWLKEVHEMQEHVAESARDAAEQISAVVDESWMFSQGGPLVFDVFAEGPPDTSGFSDELKRATSNAVIQGLEAAFNGGDIRSILAGFGQMLGQAVGNHITASMGGLKGGIAGGLAGIGIGIGVSLLSSILGGSSKVNFLGAIENLEASSDALLDAAKSLRDSLSAIMRTAGGMFPFPTTELRERDGQYTATYAGGVGYRGSWTGGGVMTAEDLIPAIIGEGGGEAIVDKIMGVGSSVQAAMDDFFREWLDIIQAGLADGVDLLSGWPSELVNVVKASSAASLNDLNAELQRAVEIIGQSQGKIRSSIFTTFNELAVMVADGLRLGLSQGTVTSALRSGIDALFAGVAGFTTERLVNVGAALEDVQAGLERVGIAGEQAEKILGRAAKAFDIYNQKIQTDVLQRLVNVFQQVPALQERSVRLQAQIDQARFQVELALLRIDLKRLDLWDKSYRRMLKQAEVWASNIDNFLPKLTDSLTRAAEAIESVASSTRSVTDAIRDARDLEVEGDPYAIFRPIVAGIEALREFGQALTPFEQLQRQYADLLAYMNQFWLDPSVYADALDAFETAWGRLIDDMRDSMSDFIESLTPSFGQGTPMDLYESAFADFFGTEDFEGLLAAALGGDIEAFAQLQAAAQALLSLGADVFGTSSADFAELFALVTQGLEDAMGVDYAPILSETQAQTAALSASLDSVQMTIRDIGQGTQSILTSIAGLLKGRGSILDEFEPPSFALDFSPVIVELQKQTALLYAALDPMRIATDVMALMPIGNTLDPDYEPIVNETRQQTTALVTSLESVQDTIRDGDSETHVLLGAIVKHLKGGTVAEPILV